MKVQRFDRGELGKPRHMPNGFVKMDAYLTRVGVFEYRNADGTTRRELRLPEEVYNEDSLETLRMSALTFGHPSRPVTADNARGLAIGAVGQDVRPDVDKVRATITVTDGESFGRMKRGTRQLSCGYWCDLDESPGVTSNIDGVEDGLHYDAIQRSIVYNHVAVVPRGRAGPDVAARLDAALDAGDNDTEEVAMWRISAEQVSADRDDASEQLDTSRDSVVHGKETSSESHSNQLDVIDGDRKNLRERQHTDNSGENQMKFKINLDGVPFELEGSESAHAAIVQALDKSDEAIASEKARADEAEREFADKSKERDDALATEKARADAAEEKVAKLEKDLAEAVSAERVDALVKERVMLEQVGARVVGSEFKADGMTNGEIMRAVVLKLSPEAEAKLDANDAAYLAARFDQAVESLPGEDEAGAEKKMGSARRAANEAKADAIGNRVDEAREAARKRDAERWKKPLNASKDAPADTIRISG